MLFCTNIILLPFLETPRGRKTIRTITPNPKPSNIHKILHQFSSIGSKNSSASVRTARASNRLLYVQGPIIQGPIIIKHSLHSPIRLAIFIGKNASRNGLFQKVMVHPVDLPRSHCARKKSSSCFRSDLLVGIPGRYHRCRHGWDQGYRKSHSRRACQQGNQSFDLQPQSGRFGWLRRILEGTRLGRQGSTRRRGLFRRPSISSPGHSRVVGRNTKARHFDQQCGHQYPQKIHRIHGRRRRKGLADQFSIHVWPHDSLPSPSQARARSAL